MSWLMPDKPGIDLFCTKCTKSVRLTYTDPDSTDWVDIRNMEGWSVPPLLCPDCSKSDNLEQSDNDGTMAEQDAEYRRMTQ